MRTNQAIIRRAEITRNTIREYKRRFPVPVGTYVDMDLERFALSEEAKDRACALIAAVDSSKRNLHEVVNEVAPESMQVVDREVFDELLTAYRALWTFADECLVAEKSKNIDGLIDHIRNAQTFDSSFNSAMLNEPEEYERRVNS